MRGSASGAGVRVVCCQPAHWGGGVDAGHLRAQGTCSSPLHAPSLGCFVTPLFRAVAKLYCAVVHSLRLYTPSCHVQCHDQPRMRPRPAGVELDGPAVRGHRLLVAARPRERAAQPSVRPRPAGVNIGPLPVARTGRLSVPVARRRRAPAWPVLDGKAHCPRRRIRHCYDKLRQS